MAAIAAVAAATAVAAAAAAMVETAVAAAAEAIAGWWHYSAFSRRTQNREIPGVFVNSKIC